MADNRMRIRCKVCGEEKTLCKFWVCAGYQAFEPERIDEFINEHQHDDFNTLGTQHFEITYEHPREDLT